MHRRRNSDGQSVKGTAHRTDTRTMRLHQADRQTTDTQVPAVCSDRYRMRGVSQKGPTGGLERRDKQGRDRDRERALKVRGKK